MNRVPTQGPFEVYIYPHDHQPPHLHARAAELQVKATIEPPVRIVITSGRIKPWQRRWLLTYVRNNHLYLMKLWNTLQQ